MHYYGINHKGDERPRLLAIPTPVITPAHVSPDGSDEDGYALSSVRRPGGFAIRRQKMT